MNIGDGVEDVVEGKEPEVTQPEKVVDEKSEGEKPEVEQPEEKPEEHKENRVQKRIDKLTRDKYQLKGENEALKRQLDMLSGNQNAPSGKPTREQFASDVEYIDALTDYKAHQIREEIKNERGQEIAQGGLQQQITEARKVYEDYDEVLEGVQSIKVRPPINEAILSSPFAAEILYDLGKNLDKATNLANMPIASAIREIGKIEAGIEARKAQPKQQKITKAPEPVKPVGSRGTTGKRDHLQHPEDYTVEEWREAERKRKQAKR